MTKIFKKILNNYMLFEVRCCEECDPHLKDVDQASYVFPDCWLRSLLVELFSASNSVWNR
jgi:hypothetical protein